MNKSIPCYLDNEMKTLNFEINYSNKELIALPGFFDVHVHGGFGYIIFDEDEKKLINFLKYLLNEGVSKILLTTLTAPIKKIESYLSWINKFIAKAPWNNKPMAKIIGLHIEGPFISSEFSGGQNPAYIIPPSEQLIQKWQALSGNQIRIVTYAPENTNISFQKTLTNLNIIGSCGHSGSNAETLMAFVEQGLSHITHMYNAMKPFHHRYPGVVGAAFSNDKLNCEVISDGLHICDEALKILHKLKQTKRIQIITDAVACKGLPDGKYTLEGLQGYKTKKSFRLASGVLAGSISFFNENVLRYKQIMNLNWNETVAISSFNQMKEVFKKEKSFNDIYLSNDKDFFLFTKNDLKPIYYFNKLGITKLNEVN